LTFTQSWYESISLNGRRPSEAHMRAPTGLPGGTISPTKVAELRGSGASATYDLIEIT